MTNFHRSLVLGCSLLALAGCGADEIASPGTGGNVIINNPAPTPTPTATGGTGTVQPAAACPTISNPTALTDVGTITGPTGTWRVCEMPARFTASATLPYVKGVLYAFPGRVDVGSDGGPAPDNSDGASDTNVTLSVEPGVILFGNGADFLMVNRGNRINAVGTATRPIVFTSRANVLGTNTDTSSGQWGGVVLAGRAPVTDCAAPNATPGTVNCERQVEGSAQPAFFGGATQNDSSGRMSYVQIRYSGFVLSGNSELQSLTTGGTGTGTQIDNIQSFNSSDDGVEFFGGFVNARRMVIIGAEDDGLDTDTGVKANLQYVIAVQRAGAGDLMIEADSDNGLYEQTPRQNTRVSNATFVMGNTASAATIRLRGGTDYALVNSVVRAPDNNCVRIDHAETIRAADAAKDEAGPPLFASVVLTCKDPFIAGSGVTRDQTAALFQGRNNNSAFTSTLTMTFVNGANEAAVPAFDPKQLSSYFETVSYIGAVKDASDTWYRGWTCDSATANFGSGSACTALPIYN